MNKNKLNILITLALILSFVGMGNVTRASEVTGNLSTGLNANTGSTVDGVVISAPVANPVGGAYASAQSVTLSAPGSSSIRYTLNGTDPGCNPPGESMIYSAPITITESRTIKAISCYPYNHFSTVALIGYVINIPQNNGGGGGGSFQANIVQNTPIPQVLGESTINAHPNGTLVLDGQTIYLIKENKLFGFREPNEYQSHGYKFPQAVVISDADKLLATSTNIIKALEGTLALDASDGKTVYMVGLNGTKRGFASESVFTGLGYSFANLPKINLSDYSSGPAITSATEAHPEGALVLDGQTAWWIREGKRMGFESAAVFNTYGFTFARVVLANAADLALPEGPLVKLRDGTLVLDGSTYYIISDGQKLPLASQQSLVNWGYKLSNVISASLASYQQGKVLQ